MPQISARGSAQFAGQASVGQGVNDNTRSFFLTEGDGHLRALDGNVDRRPHLACAHSHAHHLVRTALSSIRLATEGQTNNRQSNKAAAVECCATKTNNRQTCSVTKKLSGVLANDGEGIMEGVVEEALEVSREDRVRTAVSCAPHPSSAGIEQQPGIRNTFSRGKPISQKAFCRMRTTWQAVCLKQKAGALAHR